ncbi:MAG: 4-hydroxy-tetrahydrodipicolinate reductase [Crocinitomicaceae bacterium]
MKIALFGYGKMGKVIERIAEDRGHEISARVDSNHAKEGFDLSDTDVVIEFSVPESAEENIRFCIDHNLPIVIGTTGWYDQFTALKNYCEKQKGAFLYATNFSLGVNIFFEMNRKLAEIMSSFKNYSAAVNEIHHTEKLDTPSGTAITIAEELIERHQGYSKWENVKKSKLSNPEILSVTSVRLPEVPGTHEVSYSSTIDTIEMTHTAHSREGFGLGSILAAEWLIGKKGIYTMKDVLNF